MKEDNNDSESEHEEEFYYTEIEVNVENVTQGLSDMSTSSPSSPPERLYITDHDYQKKVRYGHKEAQRLSGRVLDSRPRDCPFEPHQRHCIVVLEQDTFILA